MGKLSPELAWLFPASPVRTSVTEPPHGACVNWPTEERAREVAGAQAGGADRVPLGGGGGGYTARSLGSALASGRGAAWRGQAAAFSPLQMPPDPAVACLSSALKCVPRENTWRKCLCKQASLSGNPAVISEVSWRSALSPARLLMKGGASGVCPGGGGCMLCTPASPPCCFHHPPKPSLARRANQAAGDTVPREAAHTDL